MRYEAFLDLHKSNLWALGTCKYPLSRVSFRSLFYLYPSSGVVSLFNHSSIQPRHSFTMRMMTSDTVPRAFPTAFWQGLEKESYSLMAVGLFMIGLRTYVRYFLGANVLADSI